MPLVFDGGFRSNGRPSQLPVAGKRASSCGADGAGAVGGRPVAKMAWAGFTLIELLIVIALITVMVALVAPVSFRLQNSVSSKIDGLRFEQFLNEAAYQAFVRQRKCQVRADEADNATSVNVLYIYCDDEKLAREGFVVKNVDSLREVAPGLPRSFSKMGLPLSSEGER